MFHGPLIPEHSHFMLMGSNAALQHLLMPITAHTTCMWEAGDQVVHLISREQ